MRCVLIAAFLVAVLSAQALAQSKTDPTPATDQKAEPKTLPDTPAAQVLAGMIDVLNHKNPDAIREFVEQHYAPFWFEGGHTVDSLSSGLIRRAEELGGGLEIVDFVTRGPLLIGAKVRSATGAYYSFSINTTEADPQRIGMWMVQPAGSDPSRGPAATADEFVERLDKYVSELAAHDQFSGAILVAKNGKPIYQRAVGEASKSYNAPNKIDTKFNLASMNKMFTAVAIAQLAERGKLSYTDTVGKHLPDYPNADVRDKVTIHHLLTHTSGMGGDIHNEKSFNSTPLFDRTVSDRMRNFVDEPMIFEPGERMQYCNAGFQLLGRIVEVAGGTDYYDYVRANIYGPTGMQDSDFFAGDEIVPNRATGYTRNRYGDGIYFREGLKEPDGNQWYPTTYLTSMRGGPAGGGYSTVVDLNRFVQALMAGKLTTAATFELLTSPKAEMAGNPQGKTDYGYGFMIVTNARGRKHFGHGGTYWGVSTEMHHYPKEGYTVVVLSNYDGGATSVSGKIDALLP